MTSAWVRWTIDESLPLGSMGAPTLRVLLEKEREFRQGLEQEIAWFRSSLARQMSVLGPKIDGSQSAASWAKNDSM